MAPTIGAGTPGEAAATVLTSGREGLFPWSEQMSIVLSCRAKQGVLMSRSTKMFAAAVAACVVVAVSPVSAAQAAVASTKLSAKFKGVAAGTQVLAVYASGASARATIKSGKATLTLPKNVASGKKVSLHLVNANGSYGGPVSIGKTKGTKTTWYGGVSVKKGKTTSLGTITYSAAQQYASMKATGSTASLPVTGALKGASKNGQPAGAGRLGLAASKAVSSASLAKGDSIDWTWGVQAFAAADADGGGDLDGDGIPNTLDIDDDGDGFPDQVDQSSGAGTATPTAQYDTINGLNTSITWRQPAINYNYLAKMYTDPAKLRTELSKLNSDAFTMSIRLVAPFVTQTSGVTIKDAWVDCTGLAWCVTEDSGSTEADLVIAPRMLPWGDGDIKEFWKYAYKKTDQSTCSIYVPTSNALGTPGCQVVKWGSYSMADMLNKAKTNGSPLVTSAPDWTDHTGGFGMNDAYWLKPAGSPNGRGFDMTAYVAPRGYAKFLDNMRVGDVMTVKALLSDGTTTEVAMTISPFFVTAPTAFSFTATGGTEKTVDYTVSDTTCTSNGAPTCRWGSESKPVEVSAASPGITVKFWRPQRPRVSGTDDNITGTAAFLDMGALNYNFRLSGEDGSQGVFCPNAAVTMTDTTGSTFQSVAPKSGYSNDREYLKDGSSDAAAAETRFVSAAIDLSKCTGLSIAAGKKYTVTMTAAGEPLFGMNRSSTSQSFSISFTS